MGGWAWIRCGGALGIAGMFRERKMKCIWLALSMVCLVQLSNKLKFHQIEQVCGFCWEKPLAHMRAEAYPCSVGSIKTYSTPGGFTLSIRSLERKKILTLSSQTKSRGQVAKYHSEAALSLIGETERSSQVIERILALGRKKLLDSNWCELSTSELSSRIR